MAHKDWPKIGDSRVEARTSVLVGREWLIVVENDCMTLVRYLNICYAETKIHTLLNF